MAMTKIWLIVRGNRSVKVFYDPDLQEYSCQLFEFGQYIEGADYFTDDKEDAFGTAEEMVKESKE